MFLFYVLTFFKNGDIIQGGTLFKGGHYLRKYGMTQDLSVFMYFAKRRQFYMYQKFENCNLTLLNQWLKLVKINI